MVKNKKRKDKKALEKYYLPGVLLVILVIGAVAFSFQDSGPPRVCFDNKCFFAEVPPTQELKVKGLGQRESLDPNSGMLFVFDEEKIYPFWMKDMQFSIDIIWINSDFEVVHIERSVPLCDGECLFPDDIIDPKVPAMYVFEINAGLSDEFGITQGSVAKFKSLNI